MADDTGGVDLGGLSPTQLDALEQFTMVTDQEPKDAIPILQRSHWNVQIAIAKFFDGEESDAVAEAAAEAEAPRYPSVRHENLQESLMAQADGRHSRSLWSHHTHRTEPAPRVVPQQPVVHHPWLPLAILLTPFSLGLRLAMGISTSIARAFFFLLGLLPRAMRPRAITSAGISRGYGRKQLLPRDAAARFRREFEEQFGHNSLPFFEGGYAQAYDMAKRELKFLLVVLLAPEHDDTESFVRDTLLAPQVVSTIQDKGNQIILWGGNVRDSEAYQVYLEYVATRLPWAGLVCLMPWEGSTRMGTAKRLAGPVTAAAFAGGIRSAIEKYSPDLEAVRAERAANEMARSLRTEQDSAYERSLARDRERARQRRQAEAAAAAAAAAAEQKARDEAEAAARLERNRRAWKLWRAGTTAPEPPAGAKDVVRLALKLPEAAGGERVRRAFRSDTTVEELYAFVECYDVAGDGDEEKVPLSAPEGYEHEYKFRIASVMPREVFEPSTTTTLGEKIGRSGNLVVEEITGEDDDESDN